MMITIDSRPEELLRHLEDTGRRRVMFRYVPASGSLACSAEDLASIGGSLKADARDFDQHEAVFLERGRRTGALLGAFLHRTVRGQGAGGVRYAGYDTLRGFLADGLRLARGMGRKNALSGLWWGGGKGVIAKTASQSSTDRGFRDALYEDYGELVTGLRGAYVTAEDAGTRPADMAAVFRTTRHTTCIPSALGGSGNPSPATARGVVCAMQSACDVLGLGGLEGKRVAMQGVGQVGAAMVHELVAAGAKAIVGFDVDPAAIEELRASLPQGAPVDLRLGAAADLSIFEEPCDIFAPNALGGVLNESTIGLLKAKIVCGAANNQLLDEAVDDARIEARHIAYVPDFLANRMGIVNCANEAYGTLPNDPAMLRHYASDWEHSIVNRVRDVFQRARDQGVTTARAANELADELAAVPHPIWGHRVASILDHLWSSEWANG